jgi:hypothetical protein
VTGNSENPRFIEVSRSWRTAGKDLREPLRPQSRSPRSPSYRKDYGLRVRGLGGLIDATAARPRPPRPGT